MNPKEQFDTLMTLAHVWVQAERKHADYTSRPYNMAHAAKLVAAQGVASAEFISALAKALTPQEPQQ